MFMALMLLLVLMVQGEMVCSGEIVRVLAGEDAVLPCSLGRELDPGGLIVEWSRPDLNPQTVHIYREGHDLHDQHPSYKQRTALFKEELKKGNVSLKLSRVRLDDEGLYTCFTSTADKQENYTVVRLLVGAGPLCHPEISILGQQEGGVLLQCRSHTWHPHPQLEWLDSQGRILHTEVTSSQADGSYTVSSNLTVQRKSSTVTCRVYSEKIDHMRETVISVPGEFFKTTSHVLVTVGVICVAMAIAIIVLIILLVKRKICCSGKTVSDDRRSREGLSLSMMEGGAGEEGQNHEEPLVQPRRE